ncbi:MAG: hypothetical protein M1834_001678 [Cirrosporium novae-zelandiae]|nr:MAG: hypothetical protein M1834_001678 [Cirrosporium novae-zelandiae]
MATVKREIVKRACDPCHRRKIRCSGNQPCWNCSHASLACTYNAIPQKKGPKGSRAKVISELRRTQQPPDIPPMNFRPQLRHAVPTSPTPSRRTQGLLTTDLLTECIDFFFTNMYPTMPILHRGSLQALIQRLDDDDEAYCLLTSLCAFMMIQPRVKLVKSDADEDLESGILFHSTSGTALLDETLHVRKGYDYIEQPTVLTVTTSFFLFGCFFGLDKNNTAWFYLREATTFAQVLGMQDEATYDNSDPIHSSRRRRLFWLLFVTERAYALQRHRPLTLHATIDLPTLEEDPTESTTISGFLHLVRLFHPFDDIFVGLWNKSRNDCSTHWLARLHRQINEALPPNLDCTESQAADLRTSQQWLRTMVWQLSIANGLLSSGSADSSMTFQFPIEVARDLASVSGSLSRQSMEVHGIGLIEKLFDVTWSLTDVMAVVPTMQTFEVGPREYLIQLMGLIRTLRRGESRFLPLLSRKIKETLPNLATPLSVGLPLPTSTAAVKMEELGDEDGISSVIDGSVIDDSASSTTGSISHAQIIGFGMSEIPTLQPGISHPEVTTSCLPMMSPPILYSSLQSPAPGFGGGHGYDPRFA